MWHEAKALGIRPSELYGIENPLAAFYLDRGLQRWANFVEGKMNESETAVRNTAVGRSSSGAGFIISARQVTFAKLMGQSTASAYRQPQVPKRESPKKDVGAQRFSAEGEIDLSKFNG